MGFKEKFAFNKKGQRYYVIWEPITIIVTIFQIFKEDHYPIYEGYRGVEIVSYAKDEDMEEVSKQVANFSLRLAPYVDIQKLDSTQRRFLTETYMPQEQQNNQNS